MYESSSGNFRDDSRRFSPRGSPMMVYPSSPEEQVVKCRDSCKDNIYDGIEYTNINHCESDCQRS